MVNLVLVYGKPVFILPYFSIKDKSLECVRIIIIVAKVDFFSSKIFWSCQALKKFRCFFLGWNLQIEISLKHLKSLKSLSLKIYVQVFEPLLKNVIFNFLMSTRTLQYQDVLLYLYIFLPLNLTDGGSLYLCLKSRICKIKDIHTTLNFNIC